MGMMLPDELVWIMDKLGFEWPDVDEDEVRRAATLVRQFGSDVEACMQAVDKLVNGDLTAAMRGASGPAYVTAWNTNRSQNVQRLLDFMDPAATGIDVAADVILALKIKVIADVTITAAQVAAALASSFVTFGAGAAAAAALIIARKKALDALVDIAIEEALDQVLPMVIEPLAEQLPAVVDAILDAPLVEGAVGDTEEYYADLAALEQASGEMEMHSADLQSITSQFLADVTSLDFGGDA